MTAMVGYGSQGMCRSPETAIDELTVSIWPVELLVFTFRHHYWIWGPIIASCCGGLIAGLLYDLFIYRGPESFINRPCK